MSSLPQGCSAVSQIVLITSLSPPRIAFDDEILGLLKGYVEGGGRLVLDAPGAWFDSRGRVLDVGEGSLFEQIFGVEIRDFQYANNVPCALAGAALGGFILDLSPTTASVLESYDQGGIAVTENQLGRGSAVVIGFEASHLSFKPGNTGIESRLRRHAMRPHESPYSCEGTVTYRLAAPDADHYFFLNDGPGKSVRLFSKCYHYVSACDPVSGEILDPGSDFEVEGHGARWLRFKK